MGSEGFDDSDKVAAAVFGLVPNPACKERNLERGEVFGTDEEGAGKLFWLYLRPQISNGACVPIPPKGGEGGIPLVETATERTPGTVATRSLS
jgi:hypothetical protein